MTNEPAFAAGLLACPFCGEPAVIDEHETGPDDRVFYTVACGSCNTLMDADYWSEAEAIAAWNRRAAPTPAEGEVEIVARAIQQACNGPWDFLSEGGKEAARWEARAAIAALRAKP